MLGSGGSIDYKMSWLEKVGAEVVKMGPIPKHVAIILDGNRRFAKKNKMDSVTKGHKSGREKVDEVTDMLIYLGVKELTVYTFSVENFKRSMDEVNGILKLMKERSDVTDEWIETTKRKGICYEFIGNVEACPSQALLDSLQKNMVITRNHQSIKVNVAFIYTGRNEITKGVNTIFKGLHKGDIKPVDLTEELLPQTFTLHQSYPVDILIRTSGECRLSDFLLWQSSEAYLDFVEETWPEFTFWGLLRAIFRYQNQNLFKWKRGPGEEHLPSLQFIENVRLEKWTAIISNNRIITSA